MSEGCGYPYFPGTWKVISVDGANEEIGHVISISGPGDKVEVKCLTDPSHTYPLGRHNPETDCIEIGGPIPAITGKPGEKCAKYRIDYSGGLAPGSWTAEDNGGDSGGEG